MIRECRKFLQQQAPDWGLKEGEWSFVLHNNYHPHCSNMNLLWFRDTEDYPSVVAKVFREPGLPLREFRNQSDAWHHAPDCVPKPLHFAAHGNNFWALWMEGVPGYPFRPERYDRVSHLTSMVDTVASFHAALRKEAAPDRCERMAVAPLGTLMKFGTSLPVRTGCEEMLAMCTEDWMAGLPTIPQHGDLFLNNMLSHAGRWYILDWETFGKVDLPFYDVVTLVFSWLRTGGATPSEWNQELCSKVPALMRRYAHKLGIQTEFLRKLLPLILANWFHVQWMDDRREFTRLMYGSIRHFFENRAIWEQTFIGEGTS